MQTGNDRECRLEPPRRSGAPCAWLRGSRHGLAAAALVFTACASPPLIQDPSVLPPASIRVVDAVVVETDATGKKVTAKSEDTGTTWTILVLSSTRILTDRGIPVELEALNTGDRLRVRGSSRIEEVLTAEEISVFPSALR